MLKWSAPTESAARKDVLNMLPKEAVGVEIGVWKGDFSAQILKAARPKTLHLVDPWLISDAADRATQAWYGADKISQSGMDDIHAHVTQRFGAELASGRVIIHRADARQALGAMDKETVDYVYVDGDHGYEGVSADLAEAFRVTKPNGFICCDDYLLGAWWKDGVVRAVHELLVSERVTVEYKVDTQIVLKKLSPKRE
jgi:SAM-dependent methyltransferase